MYNRINSYLVKYCILSLLLISFGCREKNITDYIEERWPGNDLSQFLSFELMKENPPYLLVKTLDGYGVYDLFSKKYALKPTSRCHSVRQINDSIWYMLDMQQKPYRIIQLPKVWLFDTEHFEIQAYEYKDEEGNSSIDFIKDIAEEYEFDWEIKDENFRKTYEESKDIYVILGKTVRSSGCENTPRNNLLWHQVIKEMMKETGLPQDTVISRMEDIIRWYYGGSQSEMNRAAYIEQVIAQFKQLDVIAIHLEDFPEYYEEYESFSKLEAAFFYKWIDDMYSDNYYSSLPMDVSYGIINCMNKNTELLSEQFGLTDGSKSDRVNQAYNKQLKSKFNKETDLDTLIKDWTSIRYEIAKTLSEKHRKRYDDITKEIMASFNNLHQINYEF